MDRFEWYNNVHIYWEIHGNIVMSFISLSDRRPRCIRKKDIMVLMQRTRIHHSHLHVKAQLANIVYLAYVCHFVVASSSKRRSRGSHCIFLLSWKNRVRGMVFSENIILWETVNRSLNNEVGIYETPKRIWIIKIIYKYGSNVCTV